MIDEEHVIRLEEIRRGLARDVEPTAALFREVADILRLASDGEGWAINYGSAQSMLCEVIEHLVDPEAARGRILRGYHRSGHESGPEYLYNLTRARHTLPKGWLLTLEQIDQHVWRADVRLRYSEQEVALKRNVAPYKWTENGYAKTAEAAVIEAALRAHGRVAVMTEADRIERERDDAAGLDETSCV